MGEKRKRSKAEFLTRHLVRPRYDANTLDPTFAVGLQGIREADVELVDGIISQTLAQVAKVGNAPERALPQTLDSQHTANNMPGRIPERECRRVAAPD